MAAHASCMTRVNGDAAISCFFIWTGRPETQFCHPRLSDCCHVLCTFPETVAVIPPLPKMGYRSEDTAGIIELFRPTEEKPEIE